MRDSHVHLAHFDKIYQNLDPLTTLSVLSQSISDELDFAQVIKEFFYE
jgi:hypothetical protein